jgi:hypothetical protein
VVREEPGKRKPRSAIFASRHGTAGVGILSKQRPSKCAAEKAKCTGSVYSVDAMTKRRTALIARREPPFCCAAGFQKCASFNLSK